MRRRPEKSIPQFDRRGRSRGFFIFAAGVLLVVGADAQRSSRDNILLPTSPIGGLRVDEADVDPDRRRQAGSDDEYRRAVDRPPRLLESAPTQYPDEFAGTGIAAEVMVSLMVDRMGRASHVKVEDSPDIAFSDAVLDSLAQWEFLPALKRGRLTNAPLKLSLLISEELGESAYFDYMGGRISLEGVSYAGANDHEVQRLFGLRTAYPWAMLIDGEGGEVVLELSVGGNGVPYDFKILESTNKEFSLAAEAALGHWRYSSGLFEDRPVAARLRYRVSFQPEEYPEDIMALARSIDAEEYRGVVPARLLDSPPEVVRSVPPSLPTDRPNDSKRRRVKVNLVVTEAGEVLLPRVESAPTPLLGYAAITAVNYWRFLPARQNKMPVRVNVTIPITF